MSSCPDCEGRGWIVGGEDGYARARPCPCSPGRPQRILDVSGIPDHDRHCRLSLFTAFNESLERAREAAEEIVSSYPQQSSGVLFQGPCGSGKTHLAVGLLQELIRRHEVAGRYVDFPSLLARLKDQFEDRDMRRTQILRPLESADVLVIDDLGSGTASEWSREVAAGLINSRYNRRLLTIVTSRFLDETDGSALTLEMQIGAGTRSRLYEMCTTCRLEAEDYRRQIKNANHYTASGH